MLQSILVAAIPAAVMLAKPAFAACEGGHTYGYCEDRIVHWYDPDTGEICDPLQCGGGRAPLRYDVPGCDAYTGTEVYVSTPEFMPCFEALHSPTAPVVVESTSTAVEVEPTTEPGEITPEPEKTETVESSIAAPPSETSIASSTQESSTQESSETSSSLSTSSNAATTAPTTAPATTPAPTLSRSTVTQFRSSTATTPAVSPDPENGAQSQHGSLLALVGAAVFAVAIAN